MEYEDAGIVVSLVVVAERRFLPMPRAPKMEQSHNGKEEEARM